MTPIVLDSESVAGCPLCHHAGSVAFDRVTDTLMAEINRYLPAGHAPLPIDLEDVRRCCAACGYVYLSPRLDGTSLAGRWTAEKIAGREQLWTRMVEGLASEVIVALRKETLRKPAPPT